MDLSILALYNMRGNWEESEPLALAPESSHHLGSNLIGFQKDQQQSPSSPDKPSSLDMVSSTPTTTTTKQQQQQQQQQEAAAYPLTTPAWANLAVKDEPLDEKNNDSGISPGHYNSDTPSPNSDRSINMVGVNGLSPTSASSASPEPRHPLVANDMSYDYSRHHMHHNGGSSVGIPSPEDMSRDASMSPPSQMQHHDSNDSNNNEGQNVPGESIEHPIVNSQGKVKTFRCKQCPFVAVTKRDFWTHTSSHIKPEKLLTCPKCPFVTEYKHHLEYHLRNHFGSKPYKCDKCSYSCVNKSMLNSHLKSHSNVYQFRCADCSYATKYCHSLKLHLRKYQHKPAMVLNADGTPNPLPIIDVYGTKRGPKTKPKKDTAAQNEQSQTQPKQPQQQQLPAKQQSPPPSLMNGAGLLTPTSLPMPATMTPQFQFNAMNGINAFNGFNGTNTLPVTAASMPFLAGFPYNQIFSGFPLGNPFAAAAVAANNLAAANNAANNEEQQQQLEPTNYTQQAMMNGGGILMAKREASPIDYSEHSSSPSPDLEHDDAPVDLTEGKSAPLDLSKPETPKQAPRVHASTNRRKGRAVKLDRRLMEKDSDEEMPEEEKIEPPPAQTNVYMQLKHLRNDMQHMYKYICRLEENLCTRQ